MKEFWRHGGCYPTDSMNIFEETNILFAQKLEVVVYDIVDIFFDIWWRNCKEKESISRKIDHCEHVQKIFQLDFFAC